MGNYTYSTADETIKNLYASVGVTHEHQLTPAQIGHLLDISVVFLPVSSMRINRTVYLDSRLSAEEQWEQFGHELCHVLWHPDNQLHLAQSFIDMQENQANNFALYACMPTDMLMQMDLPADRCPAVHRMMDTFSVTREFAEKRLDLYISKMYQTTS